MVLPVLSKIWYRFAPKDEFNPILATPNFRSVAEKWG